MLGPVVGWDVGLVDLKGPRHRAVLGRLIVARGRVVPVEVLIGDLWTVPPAGALSAVRTFVAALRRAIEPDRAPRTPPRLLITSGPGYALKTENVDAWRFEAAVRASLPAEELLPELLSALALWRGPAYAEFADEGWALAERKRLTELRLRAVERVAEARLALGRAADAVPELDAHVTEHPWREDAWRLLALALYRGGRQGDALAVLRRARETLVSQLGVDPSPTLARLETDILNQDSHLALPARVESGGVWEEAAAVYGRVVGGSRARIESSVGLLRSLAVTGGGGLAAARRHRLAAVVAAEELGDPDLTARVIGAYDVPAIWTRSDDEAQAAAIVAAAERVLPTQDHPSIRARLLATIALESRGSREAPRLDEPRLDGPRLVGQRRVSASRAREAALEAEELARGLDDPMLLAFALNGVFMQTCYRSGLAPQRAAIGTELVALSQRHNLFTYEVLGHLISMQAACATADHTRADEHAQAADALAVRHEFPLVAVFTRWYAALREDTPESYRAAASLLDDAGMPGLSDGLLPLALAAHAVRHGEPIPVADYGPHTRGMHGSPPPGLLLEAYWALTVHQARQSGDLRLLAKAQAALAPAADEEAAGSGLLTLGPVADYLD